ncbi:uncharacterized protein EDB91DRAFT_1085421 [Suillus paluster]|uniref:uncharacterized protein n=1 Tax=Suillus paluster TaxID=48578 RepID=UPI001B8838CE|nr:uncharacterized protein EDB91DRAFT_1085421 [Suillus paluster]KAG1730550.1 hypothetical protein EDB91DRAFT_1085421 [Suillus paluster]
MSSSHLLTLSWDGFIGVWTPNDHQVTLDRDNVRKSNIRVSLQRKRKTPITVLKSQIAHRSRINNKVRAWDVENSVCSDTIVLTDAYDGVARFWDLRSTKSAVASFMGGGVFVGDMVVARVSYYKLIVWAKCACILEGNSIIAAEECGGIYFLGSLAGSLNPGIRVLVKGNIGSAKLHRHVTRLDLMGNRYNNALTMFLIVLIRIVRPYCLLECPAKIVGFALFMVCALTASPSLLLKVFRPSSRAFMTFEILHGRFISRRWLSEINLTWGIVIYPQLVGVRACLGITEAALLRCCGIRDTCCNIEVLSPVYWPTNAIGHTSSIAELEGWSRIFLLEDLVTIVIAIIALLNLWLVPHAFLSLSSGVSVTSNTLELMFVGIGFIFSPIVVFLHKKTDAQCDTAERLVVER